MKMLLPLLLLVGLTTAGLYFINPESTQESSNANMLQLGEFAYQEHRFNDAFLWFSKAALQGIPKAQYHLSEMYRYGQGTEKDDKLALRWMRSAAEKGLIEAEYSYANMLEFGHGSPQLNIPQAIIWYQRAAKHQSAKAMLKLAKIYFEGSLVEQNNHQALAWALEAEKEPETKTNATLILQQIAQAILDRATAGDQRDQFQVAIMYKTGQGLTQNSEKSFVWLMKAAKQGLADAQYMLGTKLSQQNKTEQALQWLNAAAKQGHIQAGYTTAALLARNPSIQGNESEARRWLYHGMRSNDPKVLYNLAVVLHNGLLDIPANNNIFPKLLIQSAQQNLTPALNDYGVYVILNKKNTKESLAWLNKAAKQGDHKAQFNLGLLYARGEGITPNDDKALQWWKLAEKGNNTHAKMMLGLFYNLGRGVGRSEQEAVRWYTQAAKLGEKDAIYNLAILYFRGLGVEQDYEKSAQYLKKLASLNDTEAQNLYASLFLDGKGVDYSPSTSVTWFKKAANNGSVQAMFNLASLYRSGTGVIQDDNKALSWYKKAANQNYAPAQNAVGYMYAEGRGTKKDIDKAEEWFLKASDNGLDLARNNINALHQHEAFSLVSLQINNDIRTHILTDKVINLTNWLEVHYQPIL